MDKLKYGKLVKKAQLYRERAIKRQLERRRKKWLRMEELKNMAEKVVVYNQPDTVWVTQKVAKMLKKCFLKARKPKKGRIVRVKQVPLPRLKKKLWQLLRDYVLKRDKGICVSCGKVGNQCGHYIKKSICNLIWQYHEKNLGAQCVRCNVFLNGNPVEFRKWMIDKYGESYVKSMEMVYRYSLPPGVIARSLITKLISHYEKLA